MGPLTCHDLISNVAACHGWVTKYSVHIQSFTVLPHCGLTLHPAILTVVNWCCTVLANLQHAQIHTYMYVNVVFLSLLQQLQSLSKSENFFLSLRF